MPSDYQTTKWLAEKSGLPETRFQFCIEADESVFATVSRGILFLFAFWSGPAHVSFKRLTQTVAELDPQSRLQFVVVDIDGAPRICESAEFRGRVHGNGEAAWIRDGHIEAVCGYDRRKEAAQDYEKFTRRLLDDRAA